MGKTLYVEGLSGISGDMTVAALLDLGADKEVLLNVLKSLPVSGYEIAISRVKKLNNNVDEMGDNRADHSCQYFCASDGETPAECRQMNALYCKIGECPLRKELRTRQA